MKLVPITTTEGKIVYVNPDTVTHIVKDEDYEGGTLTRIYLIGGEELRTGEEALGIADAFESR